MISRSLKRIYIRTEKKQFGPLHISEFKKLTKSGRIKACDSILHFYKNEWVKLGKIEKFRQYFDEQKSPDRKSRIVAISGGKGGVGKTALTASLAYELCKRGKKVIAVDADFSGPNLHKWLGPEQPELTLEDFFRSSDLHLADILQKTQFNNIQVICGKGASLDSANPMYLKRMKFFNHLLELEADFILVDLSPGITFTNIDIFLKSDDGIIVTVPEATSLHDSFNFLRIALLRSLDKTLAYSQYGLKMLDEYESSLNDHYGQPISKVLARIEQYSPQAYDLVNGVLHRFKPLIVLNMVWEPKEIQEGVLFKQACEKNLGFKAEYLGYIEYKKELRKIARDKRTYILSTTNGVLQINKDCQNGISGSIMEYLKACLRTGKIYSKKAFQATRQKTSLRANVKQSWKAEYSH